MKISNNNIMTRKMLIKALLIVSSLSSCQHQSQVERKEAVSNDKIQTVEVVKPVPNKFTAEIQITGTAMPNQKVMLHAMESGYLKSIQKDIGDVVRQGDLIAVLEDYRNCGIGGKLIKYMENIIFNNEKKYIKVNTQITNTTALHFYQSLGFKIMDFKYVFHYHQSLRRI